MKLIIEETEQKMSESAMFILLGAMMQDKRVNVSLTSGRSPKTMYDMMIPYVKNQEKFKDIQYYLFDENPFINEEYGPNWKDMQELFFKPANIPDSRIHIMNADNWQDYDNEIRNVGGIDVMVIGFQDSCEGFRRSLEGVLEMEPENVTIHTLALKKEMCIRDRI